MVAEPEGVRCLEDSEDNICSKTQNPKEQGKHHDQDYSRQKAFQRTVKNLAEIIADFGNPDDSFRYAKLCL